MSSINDSFKFALDIKDHNNIFKDYFYKTLDDGRKYKNYEAELIQTPYPFCGSPTLIHDGHLETHIHYITANTSFPVIIRLLK